VDGKNLHLRRESRKEMNKKQKLEKTGIKQQKEKKKSGGGEDGSRKKKRNCQLPERWSQYSIGVGRPMANTRFLAFKCPLGPEFFEPKERANLKRFEIGTVLDQVMGRGRCCSNESPQRWRDWISSLDWSSI
jgi:hypothetical protein